jgi:capsular polysaccharide biosynthesis protein
MNLYQQARAIGSRVKWNLINRTLPLRPGVKGQLRYVDPLQLPEIDRATLLDGSQTGVWLENGRDNRTYTRLRPGFVDDPDSTNLFSEQDIQNAAITYPPAMAVSGVDVDLIGYRCFLTKENIFFTDDALLEDRRAPWLKSLARPEPGLNEDTLLRPSGIADDVYKIDRTTVGAERIKGRVVALVSQEPIIYGSWLFRIIAKTAMLERLGLTDEKILVHNRYPTFKESLELAGINTRRLIHQDTKKIYRLDHVIVPGHRNGHAFLDDDSRAVFTKMRDGVGASYTGRKIYVARNKPGQKNWNGRVMMNEAELVDALTKIGFEIVVPGTLTMRQQIETFSAASFIVGGSGSAMFNAVFCQPGTKLIDIEAEPHWINAHMCLFSSLQLDYGVFVGKADPTDTAPVHRRWSVNIPALLERIHVMGGA